MTDKKDKALKLALEAAEVLEKLFRQAEAMHEGTIPAININCQITVADLSKGLYAAAAIREALAEQPAQQQEPVAYKCWHPNGKAFYYASEPASQYRDDTGKPDEYFGGKTEPLYTSPPADRKPLTDEQIDAAHNIKG